MKLSRLLVPTLLVAVALAAGCAGDKPPSDPPLVRGVITDARIAAERSTIQVVWAEKAGDEAQVDAASITIDDKTKIFAARSVAGFDAGQELEPGDLSPRLIVEVWWSGPVLESYPVQAGAEYLRVIGEWDGDLPTPKGLEAPAQ